jgi:hypothetical protein
VTSNVFLPRRPRGEKKESVEIEHPQRCSRDGQSVVQGEQRWGNLRRMGRRHSSALAACLALLAISCAGRSTLKAKSSGLVGCRVDEITIKDQSISGLVQTWVASCRGRDFQCNIAGRAGDATCSPLKREAPQASATPAPPASFEPPRGPGGFAFGATVADAEKACLDSGHQWSTGAGEGDFACSGTVTAMEVPAAVRLSFRAGKLTGATLSFASSRSPADAFGKLSGALRQKYGDPKRAEDATPPGCKDAEPACLNDGRMSATRTWSWKTGEQIVLSVAPAPDGRPAVTVQYERDTAATEGL